VQIIESFTAITNMFERAHRVRYDAITGLTIEGLTPSEARLACLALEAADREHLARLVQQAAATPARPAPPAPVARHAQPVPAPTAQPENVKAPSPAPIAHKPEPQPAPQPEAPAAPDTTPESAEATEMHATEEAPPEPAPKMPPLPEPPAVREQPVLPPRSRGPKKPPPRIEEYARPKLPETGETHEDVRIIKHIDHGDGGRMIVRADGWHIKLDAKGKEVARIEGVAPAPEPQPEPEAQEPEGEVSANDTSLPPPPPEVMASQMTRDVVQYLIDNGVKQRDAIVAECLRLKEKGAKAFANSKDEEAVRRRVMSTLTVMGVG